jgi:hypothetical protein
LNWPKIQILDALRKLFAQNDDNNWHWDDVDKLSKIRISDKNEIMFDSQDEDRPIVSVSRGPVRGVNRVIGDFDKFDLKEGSFTYTEVMETSITVNCIARNGLEAEQLATMVYGFFKYNRENILALGFLRIDPPMISEEQVLSSSSDFNMFNVSVVFSAEYAIKWTRVEKDVYELKEIGIKFRNVKSY